MHLKYLNLFLLVSQANLEKKMRLGKGVGLLFEVPSQSVEVDEYVEYLLLLFFSRMIYYLDPSVLSGVSCFVMFLCLADYLVPALAPRIFGSNKW